MTQVFIFGDGDAFQLLEHRQQADALVRAVNQGDGQRALGTPLNANLVWHAFKSGSKVIVSPLQSLPDPPAVHLTPREKQVLQLLAGGKTPAQIASLFHLDVRTVRTYITQLKAKFRAQTSQQMIARAVALGMARPDLNDLAP